MRENVRTSSRCVTEELETEMPELSLGTLKVSIEQPEACRFSPATGKNRTSTSARPRSERVSHELKGLNVKK